MLRLRTEIRLSKVDSSATAFTSVDTFWFHLSPCRRPPPRRVVPVQELGHDPLLPQLDGGGEQITTLRQHDLRERNRRGFEIAKSFFHYCPGIEEGYGVERQY